MPSKFFRVNDAFLIDIEEAKKLGSVWTRSVEHVDGMRAEGEALRRVAWRLWLWNVHH